jgi:hypothetical protein
VRCTDAADHLASVAAANMVPVAGSPRARGVTVADRAHVGGTPQAAIGCGSRDLRLHTLLPPPGHTDLGYSLTYPHCPRCKKAYDERAVTAHRRQATACRACGHHYLPADTASSEADAYEPRMPEQLLSPAEHQALYAAWLDRHPEVGAAGPGVTPDDGRRPTLLKRFPRWLRT